MLNSGSATAKSPCLNTPDKAASVGGFFRYSPDLVKPITVAMDSVIYPL
jgi:hypothetical protein